MTSRACPITMPFRLRIPRSPTESLTGDDGVAAGLLRELLAEPLVVAEQRSGAALELSRIAVRRVDQASSIALLSELADDTELATAIRGEIRINLARTLLNHSPGYGGMEQMQRAIGELEDRPDLAAMAMALLGLFQQQSLGYRAGGWIARALETVGRCDRPVARATVTATAIAVLETDADPRSLDLIEGLPR
ncbi:hypothetical protein [Streptacidiphilus sp. PAMC 29251]